MALYTRGIMRRYVIWAISGLVAVGAFALGDLTGLGSLATTVLAVLGAIIGAFLGTYILMPRR
jgi:hypothetical protein